MRIGDQVQEYYCNSDGRFELVGPKGVVIALEEDMDGYTDKVTVRWETGAIEERNPGELEEITPKLYVNLYMHDRAYGGPQEGGWWYDTYAPVSEEDAEWEHAKPPKFGLFATEAKAEDARNELEGWCNLANETRRSPSSVLSEGHYVAMLEAWPAEYQPSSRPFYC